jgi:hypothetical protein
MFRTQQGHGAESCDCLEMRNYFAVAPEHIGE